MENTEKSNKKLATGFNDPGCERQYIWKDNTFGKPIQFLGMLFPT
jgi:hypothetical protein